MDPRRVGMWHYDSIATVFVNKDIHRQFLFDLPCNR